MSNLITTYPVFESSQVLTSSQLNQITSYLDQQNRLTRAQLIGMGIVCGFELGFEDSGGKTEISISKGVAITSEGFLISMGNCTTSWVRPYTLPESIEYAPFDNADPPLELFEILSKKPEDDSDVVELGDDPGFLDDKFVLLFLEIYDNDLKACLGNTCDDLGIDRMFTVRKLLASKTHMNELLEHAPYDWHLFRGQFDLPDVVMPRTLFDPEKDHSTEFHNFTNHHLAAITPIFNTLFGTDKEEGVLSKTYKVYHALLAAEYNLNNPFRSSATVNRITQFKKYLEDAKDSSTETFGIQYMSDFLHDLTLAYHEFRDTAMTIDSECCPDMSRFPRHVMLGRAKTENETPAEAVTYRHRLIQPPIYNHQKELIKRAISLHKRMVLMVMMFDLSRIAKPDLVPLRITPSHEKAGPLSHRAIPYYYLSKKENSDLGGNLEFFWNFDRTHREKPGGQPLLPGYENQSADQSEPLTPIETPLFFDHSGLPFLRIEGHLGHPHSDVVDKINDLRRRFNLPFDMVALQLHDDTEELKIDYSCGFEDLQEEYAIARHNYCGFIGDLVTLLSFFQKNQPTFFDGSAQTKEDLEEIRHILDIFNNLCELLPDCLNDFKFDEFRRSFKEMLERLLHFILVDQELLKQITIKEKNKPEDMKIVNGFLGRVNPLLMKVIDMFFYNTFLRLYYAFKRREFYLRRETATFAGYLASHPGMEHQAGVPKGGTFALIYRDGDSPETVADFALPYRCCAAGTCVPMCDDDDAFDFRPAPFARPDYAITTVGEQIKINVSVNDSGFNTAKLVVTLEENASQQGGKVTLVDDAGTIGYEPPADFTGYDFFNYTLSDQKETFSDIGRVTVLVKSKEQDVTGGCYPPSLLECWVDGNIQILQLILQSRQVNFPDSATIADLADLLHENLKTTRGFTDDELDSREDILENTERRRQLLRCIDPSMQVDSMKWEALGNEIRRYQSKYCVPDEEPLKECYNKTILECLTDNKPKNLITYYDKRNPENNLDSNDPDTVYQHIASYLNANGGFTAEDLDSGFLSNIRQKRKLLDCLNIFYSDNMTSEQLGERILGYQTENCGGDSDNDNVVVVNLSENDISVKEAVAVLNARGIRVTEDQPEEKIIEKLKNTNAGLSFTRNEVELFTKDRINDIMKLHGIGGSSGSTKNKLIDNLFRGLK